MQSQPSRRNFLLAGPPAAVATVPGLVSLNDHPGVVQLRGIIDDLEEANDRLRRWLRDHGGPGNPGGRLGRTGGITDLMTIEHVNHTMIDLIRCDSLFLSDRMKKDLEAAVAAAAG